jgi:ubiquinone biosynthesis protein
LRNCRRKHVPASRRLRPVAIAETLAQSTKIEMDLRLEAAALSELHENTKDDPGFRVPKVDWQRTGRDVLTLEWVDGIKMSEIDALREPATTLNKLADTVVQSFLRHAMRDGFFHADMHPGNLFVDPKATSSPSIWALPGGSA